MVVFKTLHILWNLKPMILVIWGFYSMIVGTMQAENTQSMLNNEQSQEGRSAVLQACSQAMAFTTVDYQGQSFTVEQTFEQTCTDRGNWWCINTVTMKENESDAMMMTYPYLLLCLFWLIVVFCQSGFYKYGFNQVGYHMNFLLVRQRLLYKVATVMMIIYPLLFFFYGCYSILEGDGDHLGDAIPTLFNGVIQTFLGVFALYSPVEETLEYSEAVLESKITPRFFAESASAIATWQDAILSAEKGEYSHWEKITSTGPSVFQQVYQGITAVSTSGEATITIEDGIKN